MERVDRSSPQKRDHSDSPFLRLETARRIRRKAISDKIIETIDEAGSIADKIECRDRPGGLSCDQLPDAACELAFSVIESF